MKVDTLICYSNPDADFEKDADWERMFAEVKLSNADFASNPIVISVKSAQRTAKLSACKSFNKVLSSYKGFNKEVYILAHRTFIVCLAQW